MAIVRRRTRKPNKINRSNEIGRLVDMYVPLSDFSRKDIAGGLVPTENNQEIVTSVNGKITNSEFSTFTNYGDVHDIGTSSFFVGIRFKTSNTLDGCLFSKSLYAGSPSRWYVIIRGTTQVEFGLVDGNDDFYIISAIGNYADDVTHDLIIVHERGVENRVYIDGVRVATIANTGLTDTDSLFALLIGAYNDSVDGLTAHTDVDKLQFIGELSNFILGHHAITDKQVASLYGNFNQILQNKTRTITSNTEAVTVPFQAAWAMVKSHILGAR